MMRSNARGRGAQMVFPEASAAPGAAASAASRSRKASGANDTSASKKMATGARARHRSTFQASGFPARVVRSATTASGGRAGGSAAGRTPSAVTSANDAAVSRAKARRSRSAADASGSGPLMQTSSSTDAPSPAGSAARAAPSVRASAGSSVRHGTARVRLGPSRIGRERVEGDARAHDARIRRGGAAPADRRRERRLETELARPDGAEEAQVAGRTPRGVEAHLALHDLGLAADPEPLRCTHVRPVDGARRGHVDGARPEARGPVAEVQILAVEEVARIEAAELPEEVSAHRHE